MAGIPDALDLTPVDHDPFESGAAFGTGSPAEASGQPSGLAALASLLYGSVGGLAKTAIQGSQADLATMGSGEPKQSVGPAAETALSLAGLHMPFAQPGTLGVAGGRLSSRADDFRNSVHAARDQMNEQMQQSKIKYWKDIDASKDLETIRREQGYNTPAYRGIRLFEEGQTPNMEHNFSRNGDHYSTASPMLSDMYAGGLDRHPGWKVPEDSFHNGSQVLPLRLDTSKYHYHDAAGGHWTTENDIAIQAAKEKGAPGVVVDNVWDEPSSTSTLSRPQRVFITFPEGATTVKSRFASKFDPADPNMMHGIAAVGVGGPAGYLSQQPSQDSPSQHVQIDPNLINIVKKYGMAGISMLPPAAAAFLSQRMKAVDHNPFARGGNPAMTPVDHDPFNPDEQT